MGEPALADDILSRSATDILSLYRSKQVSPVEVLTATLDRIDRLDRFYNAFVMIDRQGAFYDAQASKIRWRHGEPNGHIDGLPVSVKDLVVVKGMPTRRGSRTTNPLRSEEDGPPVARMRQPVSLLDEGIAAVHDQMMSSDRARAEHVISLIIRRHRHAKCAFKAMLNANRKRRRPTTVTLLR